MNVKDFYGTRWLKEFPYVYPNMSKEEFDEINGDSVVQYYAEYTLNSYCNNYEWARDEFEKDEWDYYLETTWQEFTEYASDIKKVKSSKIKKFPNSIMANTFISKMYNEQSMLYFPVWSKNDNNFLLFFIGMR